MKANITDIQIIFSELPNRYIHGDVTFDNYQLLTDLHFLHGWREVEIPTFNQDTQKLSDVFVLEGDLVTKEVIELTTQEIADLARSRIPSYISRMNLKIILLLRGIELQDIIDTINSIPESMFSAMDKQIAIIKFNEAVSFDRYNADLNLVGVLMGLSQEDLDNIFLEGNNL